MSNFVEYNNLYAFHPGYYISEIIEDMEITHNEFASRMGISANDLDILLEGNISINDDIANKLSFMTGSNVDLWINLQKDYDEAILKIKQQQDFDAQKSVAVCIDYSFFVKVANLPMTRKILGKIYNLCEYLNISNLCILKQPDFLVSFRKGVPSFEIKNLINARAWVQTAINMSREIHTEFFNLEKLNCYLPEIRNMTTYKPNVFLPRLKEIFSECGVAFVLLPHLKNSGINGAVKWINNNQRVLLAINDRRFYADTFWFTMFHEIKHILQQRKEAVFISFDKNDSQSDEYLEAEADSFAQEYLIPSKDYNTFVNNNKITSKSIKLFAAKINVHPGIVVGRLQHDKYIPHNKLNSLKEKYKIIVN